MFDVYHRKNKEIEDLTSETSQLHSEIVILKRNIADLEEQKENLLKQLKGISAELENERNFSVQNLEKIKYITKNTVYELLTEECIQ